MDAEHLSQKFADSLLPTTVFFGIIGGFGIIANAYVFYVYKNNYSRCNFRTFVLCLALVDFFSCLFVFPSEMYGHRILFSYPPSAAWFCKAKTVLSGADVFMSSFVLLLIAIDRFKKVCRPLGKQMKTKTALRLCLLIFGIGSVFVIPCPILFGIQTSNITYEEENFEITSCMKDDEYKDSMGLTIYVAIAYYSPVVAFMVITMVLYAMLIRKIFFGSFLKFEKKIPCTKYGAPADNEQSTSEPDVIAGSETEMNRDVDEDNADNEITDIENIELQVIDNQETIKESGTNDEREIQDTSDSKKVDINMTVESDRPIEGKRISGKKLIRNDPRKNEEMDMENSEGSQKKNPKLNPNKVKRFDERDIPLPKVQDKGQANENRMKNEDIQDGSNKETINSNKVHKLVLNELKTIHKQKINSLPNAFTRKTAVGKETFKRLKNQRVCRKRNIKTRSLIMFVVTLIFIITTSIYFSIFTLVYRKENILDLVSPDFAALFFLCWRIYFINHIINPFVYGFLDPRFRKAIKISTQKLYRRISKFRLSSIRRSINLI